MQHESEQSVSDHVSSTPGSPESKMYSEFTAKDVSGPTRSNRFAQVWAAPESVTYTFHLLHALLQPAQSLLRSPFNVNMGLNHPVVTSDRLHIHFLLRCFKTKNPQQSSWSRTVHWTPLLLLLLSLTMTHITTKWRRWQHLEKIPPYPSHSKTTQAFVFMKELFLIEAMTTQHPRTEERIIMLKQSVPFCVQWAYKSPCSADYPDCTWTVMSKDRLRHVKCLHSPILKPQRGEFETAAAAAKRNGFDFHYLSFFWSLPLFLHELH